jgi:enterochelin esterase-like enzyme
MKKTPFKIQLDDEIIDRLEKQGGAVGGQSGNTLAAMILAEFSRVAATSGSIWEALGRIHEEGTGPARLDIENGAAALPRSRRGEIAVSR